MRRRSRTCCRSLRRLKHSHLFRHLRHCKTGLRRCKGSRRRARNWNGRLIRKIRVGARTESLIKVGSVCKQKFATGRIVKLPSFVLSRVSNKKRVAKCPSELLLHTQTYSY